MTTWAPFAPQLHQARAVTATLPPLTKNHYLDDFIGNLGNHSHRPKLLRFVVANDRKATLHNVIFLL